MPSHLPPLLLDKSIEEARAVNGINHQHFIVLSPKELANTVLYPFRPFSVVPQRITLMPNATEFMFNKRIVPV